MKELEVPANGRGIEHHDVGVVAGLQHPAVMQAEIVGGQGRQAA